MKLGEIAQKKKEESMDTGKMLLTWLEEEGLSVNMEAESATLHYGAGEINLYIQDSVLFIEKETVIECGCDVATGEAITFNEPFNLDEIKQALIDMME